MGHTVELVVWWAVGAVVIGATTGVVALVIRRLAGREWTDAHILEAAVAFGVVLSFVVLVFAIALAR
jgi:hypothetical protein